MSGQNLGKSTMTKADIVEKVYQKIGFSKKEASELVELVFGSLKDVLQNGDKVKISGFGNFVVRGVIGSSIGSSGDVAQLGEHRLCKAGVEGSSPFVSSFRKARRNATLRYLPTFGSAARNAPTRR